MKILLFADLHARKLYRNLKAEGVLRDVLATLEEIALIADENEVGSVFFLGDLFHKIGTISVELLARTYQSLLAVCGGIFDKDRDIHFIVGNHDISGNYTSLVPFRWMGTIIDSPRMEMIDGLKFFCFPYTKGDYMWEEADVFLGHIGFTEGELDASDMKLKEEISVHDLKGFYRLALCGHYHKRQEVVPGVHYVGSPLQLSFGETGQKKYCVILDTESLGLEWIELTKARKYEVFEINEKSDFPPGDALANSIIRFRVRDGLDTRMLLNKVPEESEYVIEKAIIDSPAKARLDPEMSTDELIAKYLEMVDTSYNKGALTKIAKLIMAKG